MAAVAVEALGGMSTHFLTASNFALAADNPVESESMHATASTASG